MRRQRQGWRARRYSHSRPRRRSQCGAARGDAGDEIKGAADAKSDRDRQLLSVLVNPDVLAGMAVGDEEQIGGRGGQALADLGPVGLCGRAAVATCDAQTGIEAGQFRGGALGDAGGRRRERKRAILRLRPVRKGGKSRRSRLRVRPVRPLPDVRPRARRRRRVCRDRRLRAPVRRRDAGARS